MDNTNVDTAKKEALLSMLKYIDTVFTREKIWYSLAYGTLLGAVREKGFIPWDVDLDICVKYKDIQRIRELLMSNTNCLYHLCVPGQEKKYTSNHDRLILKGASDYDCHVDIYTLIGLPCNLEKARKYIHRTCTISSLFAAKHKTIHSTKKKALLLPAKALAMLFSDHYIARFYKKQSEKYPMDATEYVSVIGAAYKEVYDKSMFSEIEPLAFENHKFMCISEYDRYLRQLYGEYTIPKKQNYVVKQ